MKKLVTVEKVVCDFCSEESWFTCGFCGRDLCNEHAANVKICGYGDTSGGFRCSVCLECKTNIFLPIIDHQKSATEMRFRQKECKK